MASERLVSSASQPRVEVVDERRDMQSMLEIDTETADPDYIYRFVRDEKLNVARKKMKGYRPVTKEDGVQTAVEADDSADGLIRVGDTILMRCPRARYRRRRKEIEEVTRQKLRVPKKKVKQMARKAGVKVIEDEETSSDEED